MRPSRDQWAMEMVKVTAKRATCLRRQVGCVLLNERGHVLATGYNGVASGMQHCNEALNVDSLGRPMSGCDYPHACAGAKSQSGTNLDGCEAIHAEQNALLQCRNVYEIHACYVSCSPCITCTKLLLNTSCQEIFFEEEYPMPCAKDLWLKAGRRWVKL